MEFHKWMVLVACLSSTLGFFRLLVVTGEDIPSGDNRLQISKASPRYKSEGTRNSKAGQEKESAQPGGSRSAGQVKVKVEDPEDDQLNRTGRKRRMLAQEDIWSDTSSEGGVSKVQQNLQDVFWIGEPALFVTANMDVNMYTMANKYKRSFLYHEYLMYSDFNRERVSRVALYDPQDVTLVEQNLDKEMYWATLNASGVQIGMTITNMTFRKSVKYFGEKNNHVSCKAVYQRGFISKETIPPKDIWYEVPTNSRHYRAHRTLIDFASFGLLRWQLSDNEYVTWANLTEETEALHPLYISEDATITPKEPSWKVTPLDFNKIENPCLPDAFLLYLIVGTVDAETNQVYLDIPIFNIDSGKGNFANLTSSFCPIPGDGEAIDECGAVTQLMMTNDHLIALTNKGVYISSSLNTSDKEISEKDYNKPLLSYTLIDPCANFKDNITCFQRGVTTLSSQTIHSLKLYYNPVCNLFQYPFYEDRVIFVAEHTIAPAKFDLPVKGLTILYASTPYKEWKALMIGVDKYNKQPILSLVGIFFNHQLGVFDMTLKVMNKTENNTNFLYHRFVLPENQIKDVNGFSEIDGYLGDGFLEKIFPSSFALNHVFVSPISMDVFFVGDQLWIAESGEALIYPAMSGLSVIETSDGSKSAQQLIEKCSFNHPDRAFVCVSSDNTRLVVGKVGSQFSPYTVEVSSLLELSEAAGPHGIIMTPDFFDEVIKYAIYTAAYSGNILMWYLYDKEKLTGSQVKALRIVEDLNRGHPGVPDFGCSELTKGKLFQNELKESCLAYSTYGNFSVLHAGANPFFAEVVLSRSQAFFAPGDDLVTRGAHFRMISIHPTTMEPLNEPTAGPLVPFFVDSSTTYLFEAKFPGDDTESIYLSAVHVGHQLTSINTTYNEQHTTPGVNKKLSGDKSEMYNFEIYIRHLRPTDKFLDGFRQVLYGTIIKAPALKPMPVEFTVLQVTHSNLVFILNRSPNDADKRTFTFGEEHIGMTHYFPGKFSVLLMGLVDSENKIMWGYSTVHVRMERSHCIESFFSFLIDMSTKAYRKSKTAPFDPPGSNAAEWKAYEESLVKKQTDEQIVQDELYNKTLLLNLTLPPLRLPDVPLYKPLEKVREACGSVKPSGRKRSVEEEKPVSDPRDTTKDNIIRSKRSPMGNETEHPWVLADGGCHHILKLKDNPVLYSHGGKISLDIHDSISFTVVVRALTQLGKIMLYRPLIVITNANTDILAVEKQEDYSLENHYQSVKITLTPTGMNMGSSTVMIRTIMTSLQCAGPSSMTFVVLLHRAEGRRLFVNYPIPVCMLPYTKGGPYRPWFKDHENCIEYSRLLEGEREDPIKVGTLTVFTKLKPNYRPPSIRGEQIPLSSNVYNADPAAPKYNDWYIVTKNSSTLKQCNYRNNRSSCNCTDSDRLSDSERFTDCKEMVYTVQRSKLYMFSIDYDPVMQDKDQHKEFFTVKGHLSVRIEELNSRTEFSISSDQSDILKAINDDEVLNEGNKYYDAKTLKITLHGTGLYHFRASLGKFDSFEEVTGYFMIYSDSTELNHVKLIVVMLITITLCFTTIFIAFLRVRRSLCAQLPFQTAARPRFKTE